MEGSLCPVSGGSAHLYGSGMCGKENQSRAEDEYEKLSEQTGSTVSMPEPEETEPESEIPVKTEEPLEEKDPMAVLEELGVPVPEKTVVFTELKENTNEDIYAWIYIPDTKIDYPVLQHLEIQKGILDFVMEYRERFREFPYMKPGSLLQFLKVSGVFKTTHFTLAISPKPCYPKHRHGIQIQ